MDPAVVRVVNRVGWAKSICLSACGRELTLLFFGFDPPGLMGQLWASRSPETQ
jgi:hypothetical protein